MCRYAGTHPDAAKIKVSTASDASATIQVMRADDRVIDTFEGISSQAPTSINLPVGGLRCESDGVGSFGVKERAMRDGTYALEHPPNLIGLDAADVRRLRQQARDSLIEVRMTIIRCMSELTSNDACALIGAIERRDAEGYIQIMDRLLLLTRAPETSAEAHAVLDAVHHGGALPGLPFGRAVSILSQGGALGDQIRASSPEFVYMNALGLLAARGEELRPLVASLVLIVDGLRTQDMSEVDAPSAYAKASTGDTAWLMQKIREVRMANGEGGDAASETVVSGAIDELMEAVQGG